MRRTWPTGSVSIWHRADRCVCLANVRRSPSRSAENPAFRFRRAFSPTSAAWPTSSGFDILTPKLHPTPVESRDHVSSPCGLNFFTHAVAHVGLDQRPNPVDHLDETLLALKRELARTRQVHRDDF